MVQKLGSTDMVAPGNVPTNNPSTAHIQFRGWKRFLVFPDEGRDFSVRIRVHSPADTVTTADPRYPLTLSVMWAYSVSGGWKASLGKNWKRIGPTFDKRVKVKAKSNRLYAVEIRPRSNHVRFSVSIERARNHALETWEPGESFYIWGKGGDPPIEQFFYVPPSVQNRPFRVHLETEKGGEKAKLEVIDPTAPNQPVATLQTLGWATKRAVKEPAYFASGSVALANVPASGSIYKFRLTNPDDAQPTLANPNPPSTQPIGNTWVRFGPEIPPYISNDPDRLMCQILHKEFPAVRYYDTSGNLNPSGDTYRVSLCATRQELQVPPDAEIIVRIGGETTREPAANSAAVSAAETTAIVYDDADPVSGDCVASLSWGGREIARGTDRLEMAYFVRPPVWDGKWWNRNPLYMIWDNMDGEHADILAREGNYDVVRVDKPAFLDRVVSQGMKSVGTLWTQSMKTHFTSAPEDPRVLFWQMHDEPDNGRKSVGDGSMRERQVIFDEYYDLCTKTTHPIGLTLMHPFAFGDFTPGCDVVMTDGLIKTGSSGPDSSAWKVSEWAQAGVDLSTVPAAAPGPRKRVISVLFLMDPHQMMTHPQPDEYELQFLKLWQEGVPVDRIGAWQFGSYSKGGGTNRLDLDLAPLWTRVGELNGRSVTYRFLRRGWQTISLPGPVLRSDLELLFPTAAAAADDPSTGGRGSTVPSAGGNPIPTGLAPEKVYLVDVPGSATSEIRSPLRTKFASFARAGGWWLLPAIGRSVRIADIRQVPAPAITQVEVWDGSSFRMLDMQWDSIEPGECYRVYLSQATTLQLG